MAASTIRWSVVLVLCAALGLHNGSRSGPTTLVEELRQRYEVDYAGAGQVIAAYTVTYAFAQLFGGLLTDRFGSRRLLLIGLGVMVAGSSLFAVGQTYLLALIGRMTMGVAGGFIYAPAITYCFAAFDRSARGRAMGYAQSGTGAGLVISMTILPLVFEVSGLTVALLVYPLLAVALWCAVWLLLDPLTEARKPARGGLVRLARMRDFWLTLIGFAFLGQLGQSAVASWLPTYLRNDYGFGPVDAGLAASVVAFGLMVFPAPFGVLADRLQSRRRVMLLGSMLTLAGAVLLVLTADPYLAVFAALLVSAATAALLPMQQVYASERFAAVGAGTAVGLINSGGQIATSVGGPLYGSMLDFGWGFEAIWISTMILALIRLGVVLLLGDPHVADEAVGHSASSARRLAPEPARPPHQ